MLVFHTQESERLYLDQTMVIGCARVKFAQFYWQSTYMSVFSGVSVPWLQK